MPDLFRDSLPQFTTHQITVGTAAAALLPHKLELNSGVLLLADEANTGVIYVGPTDEVSTTNGFPIGAGKEVPISIDDLGKVYAMASAAGQTLHVLAQ